MKSTNILFIIRNIYNITSCETNYLNLIIVFGLPILSIEGNIFASISNFVHLIQFPPASFCNFFFIKNLEIDVQSLKHYTSHFFTKWEKNAGGKVEGNVYYTSET